MVQRNYESISPITSTLSNFDLDNIAGILAEPTKYDWFNAQLIRLCGKADPNNLEKLAATYPDVVAAYLIYKFSCIPKEFHSVIEHWEEYYKMFSPHILKES